MKDMTRTAVRRSKRKVSRIVIGCSILCVLLLGAVIYGLWGGGLAELADQLEGQPTANMPIDEADQPSLVPEDKPITESTEHTESVHESNAQVAKRVLDKMTLEQKIGQLLYVDLTAVMEEQPQLEKAAALESLSPGGVILFRDQFQVVEDTVLTTSLLSHLNSIIPVWIGTDQEGGLVTRVSYASELNGDMALAATGKTELAQETAKRTVKMLQQLGLNMNFAPVADVNMNPNNPVIGIRSFGGSPERVGDFVQAYITGMHEQGMPSSVKHFPGHGDTAVDSHLGLPQLNHSKEEMEQSDWVPFQKAITAGVDFVMTAHVTVPALDAAQVTSKQDGQQVYVPATLSKKIVTGILREQLGFDGVVITDALNMGAIASHFGVEDAALRAIDAGVDMLLMPPQPTRVKQALVQAVQEGKLSENRIDESVLRILQAKVSYGLIDENGLPATVKTYDEQLESAKLWVKNNDDAAFALQVARQAITYTGETSQLPIIDNQVKRVVLLGTDSYALKAFSQAVQASMSDQAQSSPRTLETWMQVIGSIDEIPAVFNQLDQQDKSDVVIVVSRDAQLSTKQTKIIQTVLDRLNKTNLKHGLLASSSPYDLSQFTDVPFAIAAYGITKANMKAAAEQLWNQEPTAARLPIQ